MKGSEPEWVNPSMEQQWRIVANAIASLVSLDSIPLTIVHLASYNNIKKPMIYIAIQ